MCYERWTLQIHREMERAGTWPTGLQECDLKVVAEYVSRLQRQLWMTYPKLWRKQVFDVWGHFDEIRPSLRVFKRIYCKVRMYGLRSKMFKLKLWEFDQCPWCTWVTPYRSRDDRLWVSIRPFIRYRTPKYRDHGSDI